MNSIKNVLIAVGGTVAFLLFCLLTVVVLYLSYIFVIGLALAGIGFVIYQVVKTPKNP